jgi:hypothetical protein
MHTCIEQQQQQHCLGADEPCLHSVRGRYVLKPCMTFTGHLWIGIHLQDPVFSHGQLYVAFSRARSFKDVSVEISQSALQGRFGSKVLTQNIVYKEVL